MTNPVLARMQQYGLQPRKALGQHFLIDAGTLDKLLGTIAPSPGDVILEYGAGIGILTERLLAAGARVVAIELDDVLAALLRNELGAHPRFRLVHADLARVSAAALRQELGAERLKLAGNLPYQLTSHVLFSTLDLEGGLQDAVFMVQREVAERLVAAPGTREYGILSVLLRAFHDVRIVRNVKPGAFAPPPWVDSSVIRITPRTQDAALEWTERAALEAAVKSTFNERRKVLRNTLKKFYGLDAGGLAAVERAAAIDVGRRPETLTVEEFVRLSRALPAAVRAPHGAGAKAKG